MTYLNLNISLLAYVTLWGNIDTSFICTEIEIRTKILFFFYGKFEAYDWTKGNHVLITYMFSWHKIVKKKKNVDLGSVNLWLWHH